MQQQLHEKYRPRTLNGVLGQEKAVKRINLLTSRSWGGRAYWFAGQSGTGKTTLARIIAKMGADGLYIREVVARDLTPNKLKAFRDEWMYSCMAEKQGRALIVNESHGLSKPIIELFLDILEGLPSNVVVIFTTTRDGNDLFEEQMDSGPFASRCVNINLASRGLCDLFAGRAQEIARIENLDGQPIRAYQNLAKECRNNMRRILTEIESGRMLV